MYPFFNPTQIYPYSISALRTLRTQAKYIIETHFTTRTRSRYATEDDFNFIFCVWNGLRGANVRFQPGVSVQGRYISIYTFMMYIALRAEDAFSILFFVYRITWMDQVLTNTERFRQLLFQIYPSFCLNSLVSHHLLIIKFWRCWLEGTVF